MKLTVTLGEREEDVLAYLVRGAPGRSDNTRDTIVAALQAQGVAADARGVAAALRTLHALRFVGATGGGETPLRWHATAEGVDVFERNSAPRGEDPPVSASWRTCQVCEPKRACPLHTAEASDYWAAVAARLEREREGNRCVMSETTKSTLEQRLEALRAEHTACTQNARTYAQQGKWSLAEQSAKKAAKIAALFTEVERDVGNLCADHHVLEWGTAARNRSTAAAPDSYDVLQARIDAALEALREAPGKEVRADTARAYLKGALAVRNRTAS